MTEVVIRQSGKRGSGIVIGLIMLAVLILARNGHRLGRQFNAHDRQQEERDRVQKVLQTRPGELKKIGDVMNANKTADKFLENLQNATAEPAQFNDH